MSFGGGGGGGLQDLFYSIVGAHPDIKILFYVNFWPYLKQSTIKFLFSISVFRCDLQHR